MLGGPSFSRDGELQQSQLLSPVSVYAFCLVPIRRVRRVFFFSEYPFFIISARNVIFTHIPRRSLSPFLASLPLLYSASSAPALMSRLSGCSRARSRHSSCPPSSDSSPSAVLQILRPTSSSYIKGHCPTGSLGREGVLDSCLACFVVWHSGDVRDGLRWRRAIYPC